MEQFKCLGSIISNGGRSQKEISSKIRQAKKAFLLKSKLLTKKKKVKVLETRKRSIKTYVLNIALY